MVAVPLKSAELYLLVLVVDLTLSVYNAKNYKSIFLDTGLFSFRIPSCPCLQTSKAFQT